MATPPKDAITNHEFDRYLNEEREFRRGIEKRIGEQNAHINDELAEIKGLVRQTNGRVGRAEQAIAILDRDVQALKSGEVHIEEVVQAIKEHGCAQLERHAEAVQTLDWTRKKKATVAGSLVGLGALIWPALQEIASAVRAVVSKLE